MFYNFISAVTKTKKDNYIASGIENENGEISSHDLQTKLAEYTRTLYKSELVNTRLKLIAQITLSNTPDFFLKSHKEME